MKKPDKRMALYIKVDVFNIGVAVFRDEKSRLAVLRDQGCNDLDKHSKSALASAHRDYTKKDKVRFSMVIKPKSNRSTWAHECSHIADFVLDHLGIPPGMKSTEVRAYLVGYIFSRLDNSKALR